MKEIFLKIIKKKIFFYTAAFLALLIVFFLIFTGGREIKITRNKIEKTERKSFSNLLEAANNAQKIQPLPLSKEDNLPNLPKFSDDNLTSFISKTLSFNLTNSPLDLKNIKGKENQMAAQFLKNNFNISDFSSNALVQNLELPVIADSEIVISGKSSSSDLKNYFLNSQEIFNIKPRVRKIEGQTINNGVLSEGEILSYAVFNSNFTQIDDLIVYYNDLVDKLSKVIVPVKVVDLHKKRLALFRLTANILKNIKKFPEDPLLTVAALQKYQNLKPIMSELISEANKIK